MSTLIKWIMIGWLFGLSQSVLAQMPSFKLPFSASEIWKVTRLYEDATHKNYNKGPYSDDRYGIDFADPNGCNYTFGRAILAVASGTIQSIQRTEVQKPTSGYGNSIVINHNNTGWFTRYAHLSEIDSSVAEPGEKRYVKQGQKIGEAGGTGHVEGNPCTRPDIPAGVLGVHLHFALYYNGIGVKPEPMSGYGSFAVGGLYTSDNTPQSPAMTEPAISCVYTVTGNGQFCWKSANATPASCVKASAWILYDYATQASYNKSASDCTTYCTAGNNYCKEVSGSMSVGGLGGGTDTFNLKINNFWARDVATQLDLVAGGHTIRTGQALEVRTQLKAWNGDTHDHMRAGKNRIESDVYVREDDGDWRFLKRGYTRATNLPSGATHTEHVVYTVPAGVREVSFKAKIDAEDEAYEANEGDNWSRIQTFTVNNTPTVDVTVTAMQVSTAQPVLAGSAMGAKMAIRNVGNSAPSVGIRSSYAIRGPGTNYLWMQIADDGSDPGDLIPGRDHWEEILSLVTAPTVPGMYDLRGYADYQHAVTETDEENNWLISSFTVILRPLPNFIVSAFGLREGTSIKKGTRVHPWCTVQNTGGASPSAIRLAYYINADVFRDNDTVEASELCAGCSKTEEVKNNNIKLGDKGTRTYRCCVDYQGAVTESNEGDNCATMSFRVR